MLRIPPTGRAVAPAVRRVARGAGDLPQVRADRPQLRRGAVDVRGRAAGQRGCHLDLADIKWDLGRFGKLHVRHGKGARGSGPRERIVPLINNAGRTLRWFVEDVWCQLGDDPARPGAPLFCSERK